MSFDTTAASVQDSRPREYGAITHGSITYRFSFAEREVVVGGVVYPAIAGMRGPQAPAGVGKPNEIILTLPINHALCRRWTLNATPPRAPECTIWRLESDGNTDQIWSGRLISMSVNDDCTEASFNIRSRVAGRLLVVLPTVSAGRMCPYVWGDTLCGVDPNGTGPTALPHKVTTTVVSINGRELRVDLSTIPAGDDLREDWAANGYLKDVASGEIATILTHTDPNPGLTTFADLTLDGVIAGMTVGSSVEVYAGCPREIVTCSAKFANKQRYGGFPQLPIANPFTPQSWGVVK